MKKSIKSAISLLLSLVLAASVFMINPVQANAIARNVKVNVRLFYEEGVSFDDNYFEFNYYNYDSGNNETESFSPIHEFREKFGYAGYSVLSNDYPPSIKTFHDENTDVSIAYHLSDDIDESDFIGIIDNENGTVDRIDARTGSGTITIMIGFTKKNTPDPDPTPEPEEHTCKYEWVNVRNVSALEDGLEEYKCVICGKVADTTGSSAFLYALNDSISKIEKAAPGSTVEINMGIWNSFPKWWMERTAAKNVNIALTYRYNNAFYTMTLPAGKIDTTLDWYGPAKMPQLYGGTVKKL